MIKYDLKFFFDKSLSIQFQSRILKAINKCPKIPDGLRERKILFIHIPKTGGSSVYLWLTGSNVQNGHFRAKIYQYCYPDFFNQSFKFCVVRNPYHRLVSTFFFLKKGGINEYDKWFRDNYLSQVGTFEDFVKELNMKRFLLKWLHLIPQHEFCKGNRGEMALDHVIHHENLSNELIPLGDRLGVTRVLTNTNVGDHRRDDYDTYYTPDMKEVVYEIYKEDFELFGYSR